MLKIVLRLLLFLIISIPSCGYCPKWHTETVDGENSSVGKFTSIAVDSNNDPHISYYDQDNKVIKYAFKDSSGWQVETIESGVSMYEHSSIIVNANGNPHSYSTREYYVIEYTQVNKSELKYAYKDSAGWHIETVISDEYIGQHSPLFVAAEIREIEGRDREVNTLLSLATAIEPDWLEEHFPDDLKSELHVQFDPTAKRVQAAELLRFRELALSAKRIDPPPADAAARLLADEVMSGRLPLLNWDHNVEQWLLRLRLLCQHCPELQLPPITEEDRKHIIEQLCHGAVSYKDIKEREVKPVVMSWLSHAQRELLDKHAPERLTLPNGRTPKVSYEAGNPPHIALRIQELHDVNQTPRIALGRMPVLVHILTPGMKPVQITQDLANFWREHYPRVKSELQRKYPKHLWR